MEKMESMEKMIEQEEMEISIEEFSIAELEDRLEFTSRSTINGRCNPS